MQLIEKTIAPLIRDQFPEFYKEEGELFITFVKAYYEWLENSLQELELENDFGFEVGDTITQDETRGKIIIKKGNIIIVEIDGFDTFRCNINCDSLSPLISSSGQSTLIASTTRISTIYWSRHLPEIRDIDKTIERFILQFKNKYLPNIQFTTATNKELLIKNSLDFYRAKGTPRAVDLFFKLVHGFGADVYYPSDDLFRPSDNTWVDVKYIEIPESEVNVEFVGQTIFGSTSGASAFVERFVRIKKGTLFIPVFFITNLRGNFRTGEQIFTTDLDDNVTTQMTGSLSRLNITFSDPNFEVGEDVIVTDGRGKNAKARVRAVTTLVGAVDFELIDGGWGYIARDDEPTNFYEGSKVLGSSRVLSLTNYSLANNEFYYHVDPFRQFETVRQDALSITANGVFELGDQVFGYSNTDDLLFEGTITEIDSASDEQVIVYDGRVFDSSAVLTVDTVGDLGNTTVFSVITAVDVTATGNVISFSDRLRYEYVLANSDPLSSATRLRRNDRIAQEVRINGITVQTANCVVNEESANTQTGQFFCDVIRTDGIIRDVGIFGSENPDPVFIRKSDGTKYKIENTSNVNIGIIDTVNLFYTGQPIYGELSGAEAIVAGNFGFTEPASFRLESLDNVTLGTVPVSRVSVRDIENTMQSNNFALSESDYQVQYVDGAGDIVPVLNAGFNTPLSELGAFTYHSFGSIQQIAVTSPGSGYPTDPFFVVYEPNTAVLSRYDFVFQYAEAGRGFREGETINEVDTDGIPTGFSARIVRHDILNRTIFATRTHLPPSFFNEDCFRKGNSIRGADSNVSATLSYVNETRKKPAVGTNAKIKSEAFTGSGVVTDLEIISSGFGYEQFNPDIPSAAEVLRLTSERDPSKRVEAEGFLGRQGIGEGFHLNRKSFLSSDKYIQDSDFYQEYSYQVLTALPFNVYRKTLIDVFHVAGTKPFGKYIATSENRIDIIPDAEFHISEN